jgi:para-nitrobenzyl esterase
MPGNKQALLSLRAMKPQHRRRTRARIGAIAVMPCCAAVLLSLTACAAARAAAVGPAPAVVRTSGGLIRGAVTASYREFEGIPYAAPPVGDLRWSGPQPPAPWHGIRDASRTGSECPQQGKGGAAVGNEDCLFLNVTTPLPDPPEARLPVMVWIYGGEDVSGAGPDYNTTKLTTQGDVITVTVNYRLGALGFLDIPQLAAHDPDAGNYALADQQAALRWVHRNIAAFGGDPGNVTLFGQSAGGYAVCANLAAPGSRGLFQKAIVESGPCGNALPTAGAAERASTQVAAELGCGTARDILTCLRGKPAADLVNASTPPVGPGTPVADAPWAYVAGTPELPQQPLTALRDGTAAPVPLIQGSNQDEMRILVAGWYDQRGTPLTARQYPAVLAKAFGRARAQAIIEEYHLIMAGALTVAAGDLVLALAVAAGSGRIGLLAPRLLLVGAGQGLWITPLTTTVLSFVEPQRAGVVSGVLSTRPASWVRTAPTGPVAD